MSDINDKPADNDADNKPESTEPTESVEKATESAEKSEPKAPAKSSGSSGGGSGSSASSKVTFFGQPAGVVIGGLAVLAILIYFLARVFSGGVPDNAVAKVDGEIIPVSEFNRSLKAANASNGGVVPDPPEYTKCIANKKKSQPKLSESALKTACQKEWEQQKTTIMSSLVQQKWIVLEAQDRGIEISDAEAKARFAQLKAQAFPKGKEKEYDKFLESSGMTENDIVEQVRASMYQEKLQAKITDIPTPSTGQAKAEYEKNKSNYATPASRNLNIVVNAKKDKVDAAKQAIESGESWKSVAKEYSEDDASKQNGGKMENFTKGSSTGELEKAVFAAKKGEVVGPIKTDVGYFLFEVTGITEGKQQSFEQAKQQIISTLQQTLQQKAQEEFQSEFTDKWRKKTKCADDFKVDEVCGNAPKPKKGSTAETGGQ